MISLNKRVLKSILLVVLISYLVLIPSNLSGGQTVSHVISHEKHSLLLWELKFLPQKILYTISKLIFPFENKNIEIKEPIEIINTYIEINNQVRKYNREYEYAVISNIDIATNDDKKEKIKAYSNQLEQIQLITENALEEMISTAIKEYDISIFPKILFPPVLISIEEPPSLLILSPRKEIRLEKTMLLKSNSSIPDKYKIEGMIEDIENKSALITDIGGLSTFPATVKIKNLESTLSTTAHEWFHNYMIFKPLGRSYFKNDELKTINETAANIFGDEIARYILEIEPDQNFANSDLAKPCSRPNFCFGLEMNETRNKTEKYLNEGKVSEAEKYMNERQKLFLENGYIIRKLNQAYFAFHGIYADSPSSKSTVFEELTNIRKNSNSLLDFINKIENISTENDYQQLIR